MFGMDTTKIRWWQLFLYKSYGFILIEEQGSETFDKNTMFICTVFLSRSVVVVAVY